MKKKNIINLPTNLKSESINYVTKVVEFLKKNNQYDEIDELSMNLIAYNYSLFLSAIEEIEENGITSKGSRGNEIQNPAIKVANDAQIQLMKLMEKYGMTSKDRKKLFQSDSEIDEESPLMQFIQNSK